MKLNKLLLTAAVTTTLLGLGVGCGGKTVTIWVGKESAGFYQDVVSRWIVNNSEKYGGYKVNVVAADTGAAAGVMMADVEAAGDIITVAHDNIGKLVSGYYIAPIVSTPLETQVQNDNPASFLDVIYYDAPGTTSNFLYAVPYISQALVLYYNSEKVTAEQAKSFEGLREAAIANNAKAVVSTGTDGFNFSYTVLARNAETNTSSVKLYENFSKKNCFFQGEDTVAVAQWAQRMFADPNGCAFPGSTPWETMLANHEALAVVGGAWQFEAVKSALGVSNIAATVLPTFTLNAEDVRNTTVPAGTKMQAGTFADCKAFVLNKGVEGEKYDLCVELMQYLSSAEVQEQSFIECLNVPALKGADEFVKQAYLDGKVGRTEYEMAAAQIKMAEYGMPQPINSAVLNNYYYQKGAPDVYKAIIVNEADANGVRPYDTTEQIRAGLYQIQHIWEKGKLPTAEEMPTTFPTDIE